MRGCGISLRTSPNLQAATISHPARNSSKSQACLSQNSRTRQEREKEGRWGENGREGEEEESGKEGGTNFPVINNIGGWSDRVEEGPEGRWRLWWWWW